ncbi:hypothetical protein CEXT_491891 [Caerostris extrusa]|uniref:Uncharacterized protein n=1 Tax=Caerostris extrusa TaxID=172846 RepID=A0AAV4XQI6_CAEEX|nr:hypothetical protein CEXT_491891 [Caerostris extrusa]
MSRKHASSSGLLNHNLNLNFPENSRAKFANSFLFMCKNCLDCFSYQRIHRPGKLMGIHQFGSKCNLILMPFQNGMRKFAEYKYITIKFLYLDKLESFGSNEISSESWIVCSQLYKDL